MPEATGAPPTETPRPIERRDTRETVVKAFNTAFSRLDQKPEDQLTQEERWSKQAIKAAKEKGYELSIVNIAEIKRGNQ